MEPGKTHIVRFVNNEPASPTRTIGYWATHTETTEEVYDEINPIVIGEGTHTITIDSYGELFGAFWSSIPYKINGDRRTPLDQARMVLVQQLIGPILNKHAFGTPVPTVPDGHSRAFEGHNSPHILERSTTMVRIALEWVTQNPPLPFSISPDKARLSLSSAD